ncbi:hypothetical protein LWI29_001397 [Acer saccharum]|uniref:Uncharacterized protein n=1 Tax=Acer saccharum TaxID=4024 RepID=A0AA39VMT6_ACESA|nr:hypothetical protein LWI29_001397 [Acer saccharum]
MSVTDYYNIPKGLLTELDLYQNEKLKSSEDAKAIKNLKEREHVIQLLLGLNSDYDQARDWVLGRDPLPDLDEAFAIISGEESNKELMGTKIVEDGETSSKSSALSTKRVTENKKSQDKDKLYCDYCHKQRHTRAMCWKLHGKRQNLKQFTNQGGFPPNHSSQANQTTTVTGSNGQGFERLNQQDVERLKHLLNQLDSPNNNITSNSIVTGSCSMALLGSIGEDDWAW